VKLPNELTTPSARVCAHFVFRTHRSATKVACSRHSASANCGETVPDFAALNPGYELRPALAHGWLNVCDVSAKDCRKRGPHACGSIRDNPRRLRAG
jgi:hypothetical protein